MKTIVLEQDILELEIKPHVMLDEYRRLIAHDVQAQLAHTTQLTPCICPGCQYEASNVAFEKLGLTYRECERCRSVYVSPRPSEEILIDFYRKSQSSLFLRERILRETRETRREKLFRPRAQWLLDVVDRYRPQAKLGVVVGYHNDLLVEELKRQEKHLFQIVVTNPIADIEFAGINLPRVEIRPTPMKTLTSIGPADIFMAFDILDRCADVEALFTAARAILEPGGLLLVSTTLISGFDLQVLWDRSNSIYPPERLNLLSVEGLTVLFKRHGFEVMEFSTPGMFDVESVQRAIRAEPEGNWPRFIRYLVENRDQEALGALQEYLQAHRLSSFGRVVLCKSE